MGAAGIALALATGLGACQTLDEFTASLEGLSAQPETKSDPAPEKRSPAPRYVDNIPEDKLTNEPRRLAAKVVQALKKKDLVSASQNANRALALDITNSYLQFLNGYVYHQQALAGDQGKAALAEEGYKLAVKFDPTNWIARYHLGLLNLEKRQWAEAQKLFAEALHYNTEDAGLLYNMAVASYFALDPVTSAATLDRLRRIGGYDKDPRVLQASAMAMAALNKPAEAKRFFGLYKKASAGTPRSAYLDNRIRDWKFFHRKNAPPGKVIPAQMVQVEPLPDPNQMQQDQPADAMQQEQPAEQQEEQPAEQPAEEQAQEEPQPPDENSMVIVDVVIIRTEETYTTSKGVNLLNGLQLQFGGGPLPASGFSFSKTVQPLGATQDPGTATVTTTSLNIPAITYSLNLANANTTRNEILARPTIVALNGQQSEFFSGINVNAAAVGAGEGASVQIEKEIGVKLTVTPEFLDDGRIKLAVQAERTFLSTPNTTSIVFDFRIDTSKTNVNANVVMNYGESLILSGLSEKETERKRDGVPGLQDVPVLQYLFSSRTTSDFQKSVMILLTPRPTPFVYRSEKQKRKGRKRLSRDERVLSELQARYSDWFRPYPNWASVFHHMQANKLYREFRTGDVALEKWENLESRRDRLNQALQFLYY